METDIFGGVMEKGWGVSPLFLTFITGSFIVNLGKLELSFWFQICFQFYLA